MAPSSAALHLRVRSEKEEDCGEGLVCHKEH